MHHVCVGVVIIVSAVDLGRRGAQLAGRTAIPRERERAEQVSSAACAVRAGAEACGSVVIKVGMLGDSQIGKTSLMVKYVEGHFDEDYIQTLGASAAVGWWYLSLLTLKGP